MTAPEFLKFTRQWVGACDRALKDKGSIYIACSYYNISEPMIVLKQLSYKINNIITWYKSNAMPNMTKRIFTHSTEFVIWAVKGSGWTFNYEKQKDGRLKQMRDLWQMPLVQGKERIRGSSTTAYVAKKYERQWIGIEKDKNYIKISTKRLSK